MKRVDKSKLGLTLILWAIALLVGFAFFNYAKAESRCTIMGDFAEVAMSARQNGAPMSEVWEVVTEPALRELVRLAWQKPRFQSLMYRQRAIADFRDEVFLGCVEGRL